MKGTEKGIFQLPNGNYGYRVVINRKDLKVDTTYRQDENGNPFKTMASARDARDLKIAEFKKGNLPQKKEPTKQYKLKEVYALYLKKGTTSKAHATVRKQKSMWDNHISKKFGDRYINDITLNDLESYVSELYHYGDEYANRPYSYKYAEGFLKFFYMLFNFAYKENTLNTENYHKMFVDKPTRLKMPEQTPEDKAEHANVKVYSKYEIKQMAEVLKRGHFYIPFLLGYYCGLRISETFGLMIDDVDVIDNKITVNKQLLYQDGMWCLSEVKTLQAVRTIHIPQELSDILREHIFKYFETKTLLGDAYRDTEIVIDKTNRQHNRIQGGRFLLRKENGELLTTNSVKYWQRVIKDELGIDFLYHSLRKTCLTIMASLNTPLLELMEMAGHKKIDTTRAYYINKNEYKFDRLKKNLEELSFENAENPNKPIDVDYDV